MQLMNPLNRCCQSSSTTLGGVKCSRCRDPSERYPTAKFVHDVVTADNYGLDGYSNELTQWSITCYSVTHTIAVDAENRKNDGYFLCFGRAKGHFQNPIGNFAVLPKMV